MSLPTFTFLAPSFIGMRSTTIRCPSTLDPGGQRIFGAPCSIANSSLETAVRSLGKYSPKCPGRCLGSLIISSISWKSIKILDHSVSRIGGPINPHIKRVFAFEASNPGYSIDLSCSPFGLCALEATLGRALTSKNFKISKNSIIYNMLEIKLF
jgi:hypothetical protein